MGNELTQMREQFEAWARERAAIDLDTVRDGSYFSKSTSRLFDAWQAAYRLGQESLRKDELREGIERTAVQLMGDEAPLRLRIKAYLDQCAPHVAERKASKLLAEAYAMLAVRETP